METTSTSLRPLHPPLEIHVNMSSEGMSIDEASQGGLEPTKDDISEGTAVDKTSQVGPEVMPKAEVNEKYRPLILAVVKGD
ncbi:hypothetical protein NL676_010864 [Syzygium grande]|nr:hypothetical protein NL676_010864 [Syzygium grande]